MARSKNKEGSAKGDEMPKSSLISFDSIKSKPAQEILDLFQVVFGKQLNSGNLEAEISGIKKHLYDRNYLEAFKDTERNKYYIARWSSSRALAYASVFSYLEELYQLLGTVLEQGEEDSSSNNQQVVNCLCVGAGAGGEFIGLAAVFGRMMESSANHPKKKINVDIVDISNWNEALCDINDYINEYWLHGSNADNKLLDYKYIEKDILKMSNEDLRLQDKKLITLLFTTNELFKEDKVRSIKFLQNLGKHCSSGCYLLILESAGSFSYIEIGTSGKKFPIQFLVDTILCGKSDIANKKTKSGASDDDSTKRGAWELLRSDDSCWFRVEKNLDYPMKLENMRFFYRLYRKK